MFFFFREAGWLGERGGSGLGRGQRVGRGGGGGVRRVCWKGAFWFSFCITKGQYSVHCVWLLI